MAPAVINWTQKPQTKVNPTARFPLREAFALTVTNKKPSTNHRRAAIKARAAVFGRQSRRAENHLPRCSPRRSLHRTCCKQQRNASGPRGPTDTTRLTFVARPRKMDTAGITQDRETGPWRRDARTRLLSCHWLLRQGWRTNSQSQTQWGLQSSLCQ